VYPGDIIVGDGDGVVVIPRHLAEEVARDAAEQEQMEGFIIQKIADGAALRGVYPPNAETKAAYQAWKRHEEEKA
jgi:regulator of RNase E activity RraA